MFKYFSSDFVYIISWSRLLEQLGQARQWSHLRPHTPSIRTPYNYILFAARKVAHTFSRLSFCFLFIAYIFFCLSNIFFRSFWSLVVHSLLLILLFLFPPSSSIYLSLSSFSHLTHFTLSFPFPSPLYIIFSFFFPLLLTTFI